MNEYEIEKMYDEIMLLCKGTINKIEIINNGGMTQIEFSLEGNEKKTVALKIRRIDQFIVTMITMLLCRGINKINFFNHEWLTNMCLFDFRKDTTEKEKMKIYLEKNIEKKIYFESKNVISENKHPEYNRIKEIISQFNLDDHFHALVFSKSIDSIKLVKNNSVLDLKICINGGEPFNIHLFNQNRCFIDNEDFKLGIMLIHDLMIYSQYVLNQTMFNIINKKGSENEL